MREQHAAGARYTEDSAMCWPAAVRLAVAAGGLTGLIGAALCGPRIGRFEEGLVRAMPGHDVSSVATGGFFLWFGWFGFNCGSAYVWAGSHGVAAATADRVALNMTLSASAAGLSALTVHSLLTGRGGTAVGAHTAPRRSRR